MSVITFDHIFEGIHMFSRHLKVRGKKFTRIANDPVEICKKTLDQLWTGSFYMTSLGNYPHFYSRDFGMVVPALLAIGQKERVKSTLDYALTQYKENGGIKTFITVLGKPVDFPNVYSPDSTAYMFRSVRLLNDKSLTKKYKSFLEEELNKFYETVVDKKTGLVKEHTHFGGMRDHSKRNASCYDTVMAAMLSSEATKLTLKNPLEQFDYKKILKEHYWNESYFKDDLTSKTLTADANIYPFWLDVFNDKTLLKTTITSMQQANLDKPFPIRYVNKKHQKGKSLFIEHFVPDWESTAIWPMSGFPFIEIVAKIDKKKAKEYLKKYEDLLTKYGTFLEVYKQSGKPYSSAVYSCDEGMIWCAHYIYLRQLIK